MIPSLRPRASPIVEAARAPNSVPAERIEVMSESVAVDSWYVPSMDEPNVCLKYGISLHPEM
jgi:hypothetical protein